MATQRGDLNVPDINAIDQNLPLLDIIVPADQAQDGGLSGTGSPNKGHGLLGIHMEGNALQHPLAGIIGKPHVPELDLALHFLQIDGVRLVHHLGNHIQNGEYLLRRGEGLLQHIKLLGQRLNGVEEPGDIHIESDHRLAGNGLPQKGRVLDITLAADIEEEQVGCDEQHVYHGPEDAEDEHPVHLGLLKALAASQKFVHFPLLLVEYLGDLHTG